jgi:hypothetical protein
MSKVSDIDLEKAWNEVSEASASPDRLAGLIERLGDSEPEAFDFISEAAAGLGDDATDLVFHAALVIWLAFQVSGKTQRFEPGPDRSESLMKLFESNSEWLDRLQGDAVLVQKKLSDFSRFPEPELMRYAVELVFEAHEDGLEIELEDQQDLLLVLKTLIDFFAE